MDTAIFEAIYREDRWHGGSGPGSDPEFCRPLVAWLRSYLAERRVRSMVDLGCGDLRWMPEAIDGLGIRYTGLDAVPHLIESHRRRRPGWTFAVADVSSCDVAAIPKADIYWAKDSLQHWPDDAIVRFLDAIFADRPDAHFVAVNCAGQAGPRTLDSRYHFAALSPYMQPLARYRPQVLMAWNGKAVVRLRPA